jgi:hypothetical protein
VLARVGETFSIVNVAEAKLPTEIVPVIVARTSAGTDWVVILKVAVVAPVATVTLLGTEAADWLLVNVTVVPPEGAGALSVTVPVDAAPPIRAAGFRVTELTKSGRTSNGSPIELVPHFAVTVDVTGSVIVLVLIINVADDAPAETLTLEGTSTADWLLLSQTVAPPVGAAPLSVTVPVEFVPPVTPGGTKVRLDSVEPWIVSVAEALVLLVLAVTVTVLVVVTAPALNEKLAEGAPEGIVTDEGPPQLE